MNKYLFVIIAIAGAVVWKRNNDQVEFANKRDYQRGVSSGEDNCTGKKFCAIAYVALWCPSCKQLAPQLKVFLDRSKNSKENGMRIVVGQGATGAENEADAAKYGYGAVADVNNVYFNLLKVNQYPSFFVLDKEGTLILRDQEAANFMSDKFR